MNGNIKPTDETTIHLRTQKADIKKYMDAFQMYRNARSKLDQKIIENERWYRQEYWELLKGTADGTEPTSGTLLSSIWNKHADFMDNEPKAVFMGREKNDEEQANMLTKIVPVVLANTDWKQVYNQYCWYKVKQGVAAYSVTWDDSLENGLGDIVINNIDILRIYWEPNITDIQQSRYVFVLSLVDTDILKEQYNLHGDESFGGQESITIENYTGADENILADKTVVIDCYERCQTEDGRQIVHLTKIANDRALESSIEMPETADTGIYEHGMYPFVIGQFLPLAGTLEGMGLIDMSKNSQAYIDKLDSLILKNAIVSSKQRFLNKKDGGIDPKDIIDLSKDVIEVDGQVDESAIRALQAQALPNFVTNIRDSKKEESKELTGNRDFSSGGTTGGVTAYGAITALQEAGNKGARDLIRSNYNEFRKVIELVIELIREFYSTERNFRITGEDGNNEYVQFSNTGMTNQVTNQDEMYMQTPEGIMPNPAWQPEYRRPVYDIDVIAQKENPFNTISHNQMMMELYAQGAFNPEMAVAATVLIDSMIFDGKEKLLNKIRENGDMYNQMMQMQQAMAQQQAQLQQMQQYIQQTQGGQQNAF